MRIARLFRLSPLLASLFFVACGGGGDSAPTNSPAIPETTDPAPTTGSIPIDRSQALTVTAEDGSVPVPLQFSPLSGDRSVLFRANGNGVWRLQSHLATAPDSPFFNSAASLYLELDENDPGKIARFDYSQGTSSQDSWGVKCNGGCADNYRYRFEMQGQKHYFVLEAAATRQTVTTSFGSQTLTNQALVSGQIRFEVDPSWPVWSRDRFPVNQYQGEVIFNGRVTPVLELVTADLQDGRAYLVHLADDKASTLFYQADGSARLSYTHTDENGRESWSFHDTVDGAPPLVEEIDQVLGERRIDFNRSGFVPAVSQILQPAISVSGQISEKIVVGMVDVQGETFSPEKFSPYTDNESNYYWFEQDRVSLNVRHNPVTGGFDLAYQKPQAGAVNINIHQRYNCRLVNGSCPGIRFGEGKTSIHFEGVVLQDGRILNGVIRNIGVKP